ncbi:hypothetical protein AB0N73_04660 [Microbacterium sp. NPDC089189]|uniref:hypothetical protein n=1 Tax=Microbacterium sp. NPDC089189 TaxID=3154972 RepID=UPI00343EAC3C
MRRSSTPRLARGVTAASVATFVALLSHVAGGGQMPAWIGIVVPWLLSVVVCLALSGRRTSVIRTGIGVALSQVLFHLLFVLGTFAPSAGSAIPAGHVHTAGMVMSAPDASSAALVADATMWMWHVAAGAVTVLALHRGERALLALLALQGEITRWVRRRILAAIRVPRPVVARRIHAAAHRLLPPPPSAPAPALLPRRGPPLASAI